MTANLILVWILIYYMPFSGIFQAVAIGALIIGAIVQGILTGIHIGGMIEKITKNAKND